MVRRKRVAMEVRQLAQPVLTDPQMSAAVRKLNSALAWLDGSRLDRLRDDDLLALAGALAVSGTHLVAVVAELRDELARRGATAVVSSRDGPPT
ncbi:MAG: hypothetical protein R2761_19925 [Acidimicrobiales bacterium]